MICQNLQQILMPRWHAKDSMIRVDGKDGQPWCWLLYVCVHLSWEHPGSRSIPWHWKLSHIWMVCVRVYKAETFFWSAIYCKFAPPLCLHWACPCSTLADTHWVQIQTAPHTNTWEGAVRYVMTQLEEKAAIVCVCSNWSAPPISASQCQSSHTRLLQNKCLNH